MDNVFEKILFLVITFAIVLGLFVVSGFLTAIIGNLLLNAFKVNYHLNLYQGFLISLVLSIVANLFRGNK